MDILHLPGFGSKPPIQQLDKESFISVIHHSVALFKRTETQGNVRAMHALR